ncbi:MAG: arginine N-succinyltransferase [Parvularculaceae bacterium]
MRTRSARSFRSRISRRGFWQTARPRVTCSLRRSPKPLDRVCAEMRGLARARWHAAFWNAVGRHFFEMDFEADAHNSAYGNQFIEDMMPRYPVYVALLPEDARKASRRMTSRPGLQHAHL